MEKAKGMDVSIPVGEPVAGSSSTAVSKKKQGESSSQKENNSSTSAGSSPSNETNLFKDWTFVAVSVFEWILVGCSLTGLLVSIIFYEFKGLGAILWRWCVLVLVIVCGRHCMRWMMMRVKDSLVKKIFNFFKGNARYSYYIYGLGKSVGVFLWLVLVFLAWYLLLDPSDMSTIWGYEEILNFIRSNLITLVIVGALWVVKTFLVNKLSSSFQVTRYFDWIRDSLINQHILEVFDQGSKPGDDSDQGSKPDDDSDQGIRISLINQHLLEVFDQGSKPDDDSDQGSKPSDDFDQGSKPGDDFDQGSKPDDDFDAEEMKVQNWINQFERGKVNQGVIYRLLNIEPNEVSAWAMQDLIDMITPSKPNKPSSITAKCSCFSKKKKTEKCSSEKEGIIEEFENLVEDEEFMAKLEYEDEVPELDKAVSLIFRKRMEHPRERIISKEDPIRLSPSEEKEAAAMIQQINGQKLVKRHYHNYPSEDQKKKVSCEALKRWLVQAIVERRTLVQSINDMNSAIKELNELFSGIVLILLIVIWSLMVGLLTRDGLVLLVSQIFVLTFMFGNTAKSAFEGIVFVFVKHPFDIGDLCLINGEEMVVERINLLTTVFRKNNKDKVFYSNSVLSTLPIRNFYRGNVHTKDSLEFTIKLPTALDEKIINSHISSIKERLCEDMKEKWRFQECDLVVKELEDEKSATMVLYVTYWNVNVHGPGVTMIRLRHELIITLVQILRALKIMHFEIRPQEVDRMKNTAKLQSMQEPNQQSNDLKCEGPRPASIKETATEDKKEEQEQEQKQEQEATQP